jgi:hypothetical protein
MSLHNLNESFNAHKEILNAPGNCTRVIAGRKFGISSAGFDDLTEIPGVTIVSEPNNEQLRIVSSHANDAAGEIGIQSVDMFYLDGAGLEKFETIVLNGTTPVNTVATDITFVQWIHTRTVGSSGVAVGNISVQDLTGSTVFEYIVAGGNQSLSGRYKVASNVTGWVHGWQCSGFSQRIDVRLRATVERIPRKLLPGVFLFQDIIVLKDTASGYRPFPVPLRMPAGTVVKMSAIAEAGIDGDGGGSFDLTVVPD